MRLDHNLNQRIDTLINCAGLIHNELMIKFDNGFKTHSILNWKNVIEIFKKEILNTLFQKLNLGLTNRHLLFK